ncbi:BRISC and BRCA1-A complex member 1 [Trichoplax sp. H2]|nr:BRISC and BRCA1-A complex member 1 [Trichoplax sp. H2]|eukprot:RDD44414.1 BRISC and BRCA1-A complex member 1 [Trichoplax sp. H2]
MYETLTQKRERSRRCSKRRTMAADYKEQTENPQDTKKRITCMNQWPENCPEKIVLCMDLSNEMNTTFFKSKGSSMTALQLAKKMIDIFVNSKHIMNPLHRFAVIAMYDQANWMCDFTSNPETINSVLHHTKPDDVHEFDMTSLFQILDENLNIEGENAAPCYVVRIILIYGRSICKPHLSNQEVFQKLLRNHRFFLDFLYIHDIPTEENNCQLIYETLCNLVKSNSYLLDVTKNTVFLFDNMAKLLAHPMQRCLQDETNYNLHRNLSM